MTIQSKVYTIGIIVYAVLVFIASLNLLLHKRVLSNLELRDKVEEARHASQEYSAWRNDILLLVSESIATGSVTAITEKKLAAPRAELFAGSDTLVRQARNLVDSVGARQRYLTQSEDEFNLLRLDIIRLYRALDNKIATVLARNEMELVLENDVTRHSSLAPYVLKSLNQLTLIALNTLMTREFTEDEAESVAFNRQFLDSQLHMIDEDHSIASLFAQLFSKIERVRTLIAEQKQRLRVYDAQIADHKIVFDDTFRHTQTGVLIERAQTELDTANTSLMKSSRLTLLSALFILLFVPLFVIGTGIIGARRLILRPIHTLTEAIRNFEHGQTAEHLQPERNDEIGRLFQAFNSMSAQIRDKVKALDEANRNLALNEAKYRLLAENSEDIIFTLDKKLRYTYISPSVERIRGFAPSEVIGRNISDTLPEESWKTAQIVFRRNQRKLTKNAQYKRNPAEVLLMQMRKREGQLFWAEITVKVMYNEKGHPLGILGVTRDISEKKIAEENLKTSLNEKETLLRELNHRTKNNMSIISSILELQGAAMKSPKVDRMVKDSTTRIRTMALAHEMLYKGKSLSRINMKDYISDLSGLLIRGSGQSEGKIKLHTDIENISLMIDIAIPCGLMINEILTNSLKYAFPGERRGTITILFRRTDTNTVELTIGNDGAKVPDNFDVFQTKSLGLQLVREIARAQLHGSITAETDKGLVWHIRFRDDLYSERVMS